MIHGGGWQTGDKMNRATILPKAEHFVATGYLFISINYRLAPDHPFPAHAVDAGNAVSWVFDNISSYGGDPEKIVLMGHSAGAHIAALIATDETYIGAAGHGLGFLKGLVLLDTAAYDIPALAQQRAGSLPRSYRSAFGEDRRVWRRASPITYVGARKGIPSTILFHINRSASKAATQRFATRLRAAGIYARIHPAPDRTHRSLNTPITEHSNRRNK